MQASLPRPRRRQNHLLWRAVRARLLCIGDSITEAHSAAPQGDGNWSWRYWCWQNFVDFGLSHELVGTRTANEGGSSIYPTYSGQTFVNHHESIWGTTLLERANNAPTYLGALRNAGKTPDTAVIFGGHNDVPLDLSVSAATVRDRAKAIVDRLQGDTGTAGNPNIRILLVSILPSFNGTTPDVRNARFSEINTLLGQLAAAETTATSQVLYLDVFALFNNPSYFYDGTHPNGRGEELLGNAIFAALVPDMPSVQLRVASINRATRTVNFFVRPHGPGNVRIHVSPNLTPGSWTNLVPSSLNSGEWVSVPYVHTSSLPSSWFFRAERL